MILSPIPLNIAGKVCYMRVCSLCKESKALDSFGKSNLCKEGHHYRCKVCLAKRSAEWRKQNPAYTTEYATKNKTKLKQDNKYYYLQKLYGLSKEDYRRLLEQQGSLCKICSVLLHRPHVDHCHATGKVRGLLCGNCNTALGLVKENEVTLTKMIAYLLND